MLRVARAFVPNSAVAEEVVQDTWLVVLRSIGQFEGRSSLKTWLYRVLINRARSSGVKEHRSVPTDDPSGQLTPVVSTGRQLGFAASALGRGGRRPAAGCGPGRPAPKGARRAAALQREVVTLRDVEGLNSSEVCTLLNVTEGNQRVLLHRGRSRLRQALETEPGEA